jgi:hypothetical protein
VIVRARTRRRFSRAHGSEPGRIFDAFGRQERFTRNPTLTIADPYQFQIDVEEKIVKDGVRKAITEREMPSHDIS